MEIHPSPETASKLEALAKQSGRSPDALAEDAMASYVDELLTARATLSRRYDELKSGKVKPVDGEEAFARLRTKTEVQRKRQG